MFIKKETHKSFWINWFLLFIWFAPFSVLGVIEVEFPTWTNWLQLNNTGILFPIVQVGSLGLGGFPFVSPTATEYCSTYLLLLLGGWIFVILEITGL